MMVRSRARIAAALAALIVVTSCRGEPAGDPPQTTPAANNVAAAAPALPAPEPALDREALLIAVVKARSAAATGADDRQAQAELDGKRFSFAVRMGCGLSPQPPQVNFGGRYDSDERRVELTATPDLGIADAAVSAMAGDRYEAAEGFWIPDPWVLAPHCGSGGMAQMPVGLAHFFTANDPRTSRRDGRAYEARETLAEGTVPQAGNWELVLSGRLQKLDDRVILCLPPAPATQPACVVSVTFDLVEIRNVGSGERLAEWREG